MLVFITFCIIVLIQITFYLFVFGRFSFFKVLKKDIKLFPISIIICAKNEANNLQKFIPCVANQEYPEFEIVLVDDGSSDNSLEIITSFQKLYNTNNRSISIISIDKKNSKGKKHALSIGIKAAKFKHLLLTDADCKPITNNWIRQMSSGFSTNKSIVLGYGAYSKIKNSYLNKIIRYETLLTALQYFSYALIGKAYMGVGRNIAYKKNEFINANGFNNHKDLASGDDDLFINEIAKSNNTNICCEKDSFTLSQPKTLFSEWIKQKRRHITTSTYYKSQHKYMLGIFYISQLLFWILAVILLFINYNLDFVLLLILIRFTIYYFIIYMSANKLNEKDLIIFAPIYEISIIFIQMYIFLKNKISQPKHW